VFLEIIFVVVAAAVGIELTKVVVAERIAAAGGVVIFRKLLLLSI